jgi:hypothetical protein
MAMAAISGKWQGEIGLAVTTKWGLSKPGTGTSIFIVPRFLVYLC